MTGVFNVCVCRLVEILLGELEFQEYLVMLREVEHDFDDFLRFEGELTTEIPGIIAALRFVEEICEE